MHTKHMKDIQDKIILFLCMLMFGTMWLDLTKKVESEKPFELNHKWYAAKVVEVGDLSRR